MFCQTFGRNPTPKSPVPSFFGDLRVRIPNCSCTAFVSDWCNIRDILAGEDNTGLSKNDGKGKVKLNNLCYEQ